MIALLQDFLSSRPVRGGAETPQEDPPQEEAAALETGPFVPEARLEGHGGRVMVRNTFLEVRDESPPTLQRAASAPALLESLREGGQGGHRTAGARQPTPRP